MIDSELPTDLRRPCTPSRGPASAVLAHPLTNGLAPVLGAGPRPGAPGHRISRRQSESIIWAGGKPQLLNTLSAMYAETPQLGWSTIWLIFRSAARLQRM